MSLPTAAFAYVRAIRDELDFMNTNSADGSPLRHLGISHQHPYSNNQSGYDAQMNGTTGFEGTQRYASTFRAYDDCQQSQGSIQYLPNVVSMRSENAYSSELGIGRQPAQYQQYVSQPQRSFTGTDTPALHMQGHLHARGQLDDQYREIGGQFGPPIEPSGPTQNQQGAWSAERNMQGVRIPFNETPLVRSYETLPVAEGDVRQNPDNVITDISQLESIDSQQQSMFMASLGRRPGYQEELFRAMDNIPLSQMGHSAANRTVGIPPLGPA
ncbi:hypothetical protein E8E12_006152 [Didymella heteroderae]|uniref:Uncharacterized protein n=1 Tax=Didymella heteroderae TaxID=1769908 RepID=A0A9P5C3P3_9PLEO|nr:hypothetical protein E8E12_006152 [Didymella heteroderae]